MSANNTFTVIVMTEQGWTVVDNHMTREQVEAVPNTGPVDPRVLTDEQFAKMLWG